MTGSRFFADRARFLALALLCTTAFLSCGKDDALVLSLRTQSGIKVRSYSIEVMDRASRRVTYTSGAQTFNGQARELERDPLRVGLKFLAPGEYLLHVVASGGTDLTPPPVGASADPYYFWAGIYKIAGEQSIDALLLPVPQELDADRDRFPDAKKWLAQSPDAQSLYRDKSNVLDCVDKDPSAGDLLPRDVRSFDIHPMAKTRCGVLYREPTPVVVTPDGGVVSDGGGGASMDLGMAMSDGGQSVMDGGFTSMDGGVVVPMQSQLKYIDVTCGDTPQTCKDVDGDGDPENTDCDDNDPRRYHGNPRPRNCCNCTDRQSCARDHSKVSDLSICQPARCKTSFDFDCTGRDVDCFVDEDCDGYSPNDPVPSQRDCNDNDPNVHPGARKICPGEKGYIKDKDWACDGNPLGGCVDCDLDGDGYQRLDPNKADGTPGRCPDASYREQYQSQGKPVLTDCDDNDRGVFPDSVSTIGPSLVNGVQDSNNMKYGGTVFGALRGLCRGLSADRKIADTECDGKPRKLCPNVACDADGDGFPNANAGCNPNNFKIDCDDNDPETFPGAPAQCNNGSNSATVKKTNCDDAIIRRCSNDKDGDGYDAAVDCDDDNPNVHPFAAELCDGTDNDCDGLTDEGNPGTDGQPLVQYTLVSNPKKYYTVNTQDGNFLYESVNPAGPNNNPPAGMSTPLLDKNGQKILAADALAQGLVTQQILGCTDYNVGECLQQRVGRCVCTRVDPDIYKFWSKDTKVDLPPRVTCPNGVDTRRQPLQLVPKCFGTYQPKAQSCDATDPRDDDCDGRDDDPLGVNLEDRDGKCGTDTGECNQGIKVGCDRSKPNQFAQFNNKNGSGINIVQPKDIYWVCAGNDVVYPKDEICNGKDDDCDGRLPGKEFATSADKDEADKDGDGWMSCMGCAANCAGCATGLKGCGDCADDAADVDAKNIFPGAAELCDGRDNACKGATWVRATADGMPADDGRADCKGAAAPVCCTFAQPRAKCVNTQTDFGFCGTCPNACLADTANTCTTGACKCGAEAACETNPTKPFCLKNNINKCVVCRSDQDCVTSKNPAGARCLNAGKDTATCVQCLQTNTMTGATTDCADPNKPKCNGPSVVPPGNVPGAVGPNMCVECLPATEATDCKAKNPLKPRCEPATFTCVQCLPGDLNADCKVAQRLDAVCISNQCGCTAAGNTCDPNNINAQVCKASSGCVQCLLDTDCPAAKLPGITLGNPGSSTHACNTATNKCVQCTNDTHCANNANGNFACDTTKNICVQCFSANGTGVDGDKYCSGFATKPRCNPNTDVCVQCNTFNTTDCKVAISDICLPEPKKYCACTNNNEQPCDPASLTAQVCKPMVGCVQCLADTDCPVAKFPGIPLGNPQSTTVACKTANNTCVQCTEDKHCANNPDGKLACDTANNVCVQCYKNDKYCTGQPVNKRCNPTTNVCVQCNTYNTTDCNQAVSDICLPTPTNTCACSGNSGKICDAGNKDAQVCRPGVGCVQCLADPDCKASFVGVPQGNPNSPTVACRSDFKCVQCTEDKHCANNAAGKFACDTVNNVCVQCFSKSGNGTDGDTYCSGQAVNKRCNPTTKVCVQCNTFNTTDCNQAISDICLATPKNTCACSNNAEAACDANNKDAQVCKAGQGCVQCLADTNCPVAKFPGITPGKANATTLACDLSATVNNQPNLNVNKCVQCTNDTYCSGKTPACLVPSDVCVECTVSNKTICTADAVKKQCHTGTNKCVQCLNFATDCSATSSDACSATNSCTCKGAAECTDPTKPVCDTQANSANVCVECIPGKTAKCDGTAKPACNSVSGKCVECINRDTCKTAGKPACDISANVCVQCTDHPDCSGATPWCDTTVGSANQYKCVQCLKVADCGTRGDTCTAGTCECKGGGAAPGAACSGATPLCNKNQTAKVCVECNSDGDCANSANGKACDIAAGKCVQCTAANQSACTGATPTCDTAGFKCVQCTAANSAACTGATPACNTSSFKCVQCTGDANCNGVVGLPRCNTVTNACVECLAGSVAADCGTRGNTCDASNACKCRINNTNNPECTAPKLCNTNMTSNVCVECNKDSDCANSANGKACDTAGGKCVQCTAANGSACTGATPVCKTSSFTCVECIQDNQCDPVKGKAKCDTGTNLCQECTKDSDCGTTGNVCDAAKTCKCSINNVDNPQCVSPLLCNTNNTSNVCVECNKDTDCANNANGKVCNTTKGLCVQCATGKTAACMGATPACNTTTNQCVQCTANANCANVAGKPKCDTAASTCVECLTASVAADCNSRGGDTCTAGVCECKGGGAAPGAACTGATPVCNKNPTANVCVECNVDGDCAANANGKACNQTTGLCVQCTGANKAACMGATPACNTTTNKCVECTAADKAACTGATTVCNDGTNKCVECLQVSDCNTSSARADKCNANKCECNGAAACVSGAQLKLCNSNNVMPVCVECNADSDCTGNAAGNVCNQTTGLCVQCDTGKTAACTGATPACNTTTKKCVQCTAAVSGACTGATPLCNDNTNKCVECNSVNDCNTVANRADKCNATGQCECKAQTPACSLMSTTPLCNTVAAAPVCVECNADGDCAGNANGAICDTTAGKCVQCDTGKTAACTGATAVCDTTKKKCVECTAGDMSACKDPTPACNTTTNTCVQCTADANCTNVAGLPRCNTATSLCVQCAAGSVAADCGTTGNSCVSGACKCTINNVANAACVAPLLCNTQNNANVCVECNADGACAGNANGAFCNLTTGLCGQCKGDAQCTTVAKPACNTAASPSVCAQCTADTYCAQAPGGTVCGADKTCGCNGSNTKCTTESRGQTCLASDKCGCDPANNDADCTGNAHGPTCASGICSCANGGDCNTSPLGKECAVHGGSAATVCGCSAANDCNGAAALGTACLANGRCGCDSNADCDGGKNCNLKTHACQ